MPQLTVVIAHPTWQANNVSSTVGHTATPMLLHEPSACATLGTVALAAAQRPLFLQVVPRVLVEIARI